MVYGQRRRGEKKGPKCLNKTALCDERKALCTELIRTKIFGRAVKPKWFSEAQQWQLQLHLTNLAEMKSTSTQSAYPQHAEAKRLGPSAKLLSRQLCFYINKYK